MKNKMELIEQIKELINKIDFDFYVKWKPEDEPLRVERCNILFGDTEFECYSFEYFEQPMGCEYSDYGKTWAFTKEELDRV